MSDFVNFLKVNGLKRKEIAAYLGVSGAFITQICNGTRSLPAEKLALIKQNPHNWDFSMLEPGRKYKLIDVSELLPGVKAHSENTRVRSAILDALGASTEEFLVSYLQEKIADQDRLIRELYKEIGVLEAKLELARKGETASGAAGSSCADVG
jgi:transcriptional regulator with XRE-family HTH domain